MYLILLCVRRRLQKKNENAEKALDPKAYTPLSHKEQYTYGDVTRWRGLG